MVICTGDFLALDVQSVLFNGQPHPLSEVFALSEGKHGWLMVRTESSLYEKFEGHVEVELSERGMKLRDRLLTAIRTANE